MKRDLPFWGPRVWHYPKVLLVFFVLFPLAFLAFCVWLRIEGDFTTAEAIVFGVPGVPISWLAFVRPRLVLTDDEVVVVGFLTSRYPLVDVVGAEPDYMGTWFRLADGSGFWTSVLQRPNWAAWLGRRSRADRIATTILTAAALKRGEEPPEPVGGKRGKGDLSSGLFIGMSGSGG